MRDSTASDVRRKILAALGTGLLALPLFVTPLQATENPGAGQPLVAGLESPQALAVGSNHTVFVSVAGALVSVDAPSGHTRKFAATDNDIVGLAVHPQYPMLPYVYGLRRTGERLSVLRWEADPATNYRSAIDGHTEVLFDRAGDAGHLSFAPDGALAVVTAAKDARRLDVRRLDAVTAQHLPAHTSDERAAVLPAADVASGSDGTRYWLDAQAGVLYRSHAAAVVDASPAAPASRRSQAAAATTEPGHRASPIEDASQHALGDAYWARLARDAKPFDTQAALARAVRSPVNVGGEWGPVIAWPHVAVSAANLPDGRILTFASNQRTSFPSGPEFTYAATWDPDTGQFVENNHDSHDMFCGHLVMLEDGRVFINGGRNTVRLTSSYDYQSDSWNVEAQQVNGRWYPTTVALPDGRVFTAIGSGGGQYPDVWTPGSGWGLMTGIDFNGPILNYPTSQFGERHWWPYIHVKPDGLLFHSGPTPKMHDIDPTGSGSIVQVGPEPWQWYPKHAGAVMYDEGKVIIAGGWVSGTDVTSSARSMIVDFNGAEPLPTEIAPMNFARKFQNAVMLPTGDVLIVGGNTSGLKFNDTGAVLEAELWDPDTQAWTVLNPMSVPRTYHSIALLMIDGRVLSAGGGLAGNPSVDHEDGQVYSPPYLFATDGSPAVRPAISAAPATVDPGDVFSLAGTAGIQRFTMIKMSATTHAMNTDLRFIELSFATIAPGDYELTAHPNGNVLTPGYWMLFGLDGNDVPSEAHVVQVIGNGAPQVVNPGSQTSFEGDEVSLQIVASDPTDDPLTYAATGLPPGLSIDANSGLITGTLGAGSAGIYSVEVTVSDGTNVTGPTFTWRVLVPGRGTLLREWWTGISGNAISALTSDPRYPDNPDGSATPSLFEAPTSFADNYGTRMRGLLYPPVTGDYTFWIASDDNGELWLSTDALPDNAMLIANVPGWTSSRQWDKFPEQQSVTITLQAGLAYYIEALQKEGGGGDNLAVAWQVPGGTQEVIDGAWLSPPGDVDPPTEVVAIDAGFDSGPDLFGYADDTFRGTGQPAYASGAYLPGGGMSGGGLGVTVGGIDNATVTGMSGGWVRTFTMNNPALVTVSLRYNLTIDAGYENDEYAEALLSVNGVLHGDAVDNALARLTGDGNGGSDASTGWQSYVTQIPLDAGTHTLIAGAYNNKKTVDSEFSTAAFDDIRVSWFEASPNEPPVLTSPGDQVGIVGDEVNLAIDATDPDGDALTFGATGLPAGLAIDPQTGIVAGTLSAAATHTVTVTVDDGNDGSDSIDFQWTVGDPLALLTLVSSPQVVGADIGYTALSTGGINPRYKWFFGDGTPETAWSPSSSISHAFDDPGRYLVTLTATDDTGVELSTTFWQSIHEPLTAGRPAASGTIAYETRDGLSDRVWNVNPDNDSVAVIDTAMLTRLAEITVEQKPRAIALAPDGRVWAVNKTSASISVIDPVLLDVVQTIELPPASQPHGLVFDGAGLNAYVALEATGRVLALDPYSGAQTGLVDVGPRPRHLALTADDTSLLVSRFVTPSVPDEDTALPVTDIGGQKFGGEVVVVSTAGLVVANTVVLEHSNVADSEKAGRGIPNYLGAVAIAPDGLSAWVPSKQDNIKRGVLRDGQPLTHDSTVRAIVSYIDLGSGAEDIGGRLDHDDASMVSAARHGAYGNWLFTTLEGNRQVAVVDAYARDELFRFDVGRAPQGLAVSPDGLIVYVHNFMDRSVSVHDVSRLIVEGEQEVTPVATIDTVATEALSANVLTGKQFFYDARDPRLAREMYMACAACHNDGDGDGRVWDFTGFGEGLRNTVSLEGHGDHGMLHWTANFDEVQDFEGQIRIFGGTGLMSDADFNTGTRSEPLGDPKAGISADLDALAAYVESLTTLAASPFRDAGGALTAAGLAGRAVFDANGCAACHGGPAYSDSPDGMTHDVGTIKPASGSFLGGPLTGFDTPTLRGIWTTGPWLHDGSAATLADAVVAHDGVDLTPAELADLVAFLEQIDESEAPVPLNHPPAFAGPGPQSTPEGALVELSVTATDEDDDALAYGATGLPTGLAIDPDSGLITGQITAGGEFQVTVTADDGRGGTDTAQFTWTVTAAPDTDADGTPDYLDNCSAVPNPGQTDSNGDGFGNICDADLNDDGLVNFADLSILVSVFLTDDPHADLNSDGIVNFADAIRMKVLFQLPPGPGAVPSGEVP